MERTQTLHTFSLKLYLICPQSKISIFPLPLVCWESLAFSGRATDAFPPCSDLWKSLKRLGEADHSTLHLV